MNQINDQRPKIKDPALKSILRKIFTDLKEIKQIAQDNDSSMQNQALANEVNELKYKLAKSDKEIIMLKRNQVQLEKELNEIKNLARKNNQNDKNLLKPYNGNGNSRATMIAGHQWFGDSFLYELLSRYQRLPPKDNINLFPSVFKLKKFDEFIENMLKLKRFHYNVVISIGYSELFDAKAICSPRHMISFNNLLTHLSENGAEIIKVLSVPPAFEMSENEDYLKNCQMTNRFLKHVVEVFEGRANVIFLNLDKFFICNASDDFSYFENNKIIVNISDNFNMSKERLYKLTIDDVVSTQIVKYVVNPVLNPPVNVNARSSVVTQEKNQLDSKDLNDSTKTTVLRNNDCGGTTLTNDIIKDPASKIRKFENTATFMQTQSGIGEYKEEPVTLLCMSKAFATLTKPMVSTNLTLPPWAKK